MPDMPGIWEHRGSFQMFKVFIHNYCNYIFWRGTNTPPGRMIDPRIGNATPWIKQEAYESLTTHFPPYQHVLPCWHRCCVSLGALFIADKEDQTLPCPSACILHGGFPFNGVNLDKDQETLEKEVDLERKGYSSKTALEILASVRPQQNDIIKRCKAPSKYKPLSITRLTFSTLTWQPKYPANWWHIPRRWLNFPLVRLIFQLPRYSPTINQGPGAHTHQ